VADVRNMCDADLDRVADIWHVAWHEAHAGYVPKALVAHRTRAQFADRLKSMLDHTRVSGPVGAPHGFCATDKNQIDQIFVDSTSRSSGVAQALMDDGETRIRANGFEDGFLYCIAQNARAIRFYEKSGWTRGELVNAPVVAGDGHFNLECLIFRKNLAQNSNI
jgi:ribosomal protein S18 acetylase RimI-like enzyme